MLALFEICSVPMGLGDRFGNLPRCRTGVRFLSSSFWSEGRARFLATTPSMLVSAVGDDDQDCAICVVVVSIVSG